VPHRFPVDHGRLDEPLFGRRHVHEALCGLQDHRLMPISHPQIDACQARMTFGAHQLRS
jgi:hypothetical protein